MLTKIACIYKHLRGVQFVEIHSPTGEEDIRPPYIFRKYWEIRSVQRHEIRMSISTSMFHIICNYSDLLLLKVGSLGHFE